VGFCDGEPTTQVQAGGKGVDAVCMRHVARLAELQTAPRALIPHPTPVSGVTLLHIVTQEVAGCRCVL
jgi:hypothetical protein